MGYVCGSEGLDSAGLSSSAAVSFPSLSVTLANSKTIIVFDGAFMHAGEIAINS